MIPLSDMNYLLTHRGSFGDRANKEQFYHVEPLDNMDNSVSFIIIYADIFSHHYNAMKTCYNIYIFQPFAERRMQWTLVLYLKKEDIYIFMAFVA